MTAHAQRDAVTDCVGGGGVWLAICNHRKHRGAMARLSPETDPVYIKSAEVTAVLERVLNPRKFVFQIQVEWTDGSTTSSYRGYSDFFDFQCSLIYAFPEESGVKKNCERTLPYLPGKKLFARSTRRLAESRLAGIDDYVKKLVAMPEHITQSERLLRFFRSNWQEDKLRGQYGETAGPGQSLTLNFEPSRVRYTVQSEGSRAGYTNPVAIVDDDPQPLSPGSRGSSPSSV